MKSGRQWRALTLSALALMFLVVVGGVVWVAYGRAVSLVHPARLPLTQTPEDWGIEVWEDVQFASSDGLELVGWFIPPRSQSGNAALVVAHGYGVNRTGLMNQVALLAEHGYGVLAFDFRNHGRSEGTITTLGYLEVEDVRGAVEYLLARPDVNTQRIGLLGHSMGGATVIRAAARLPQVQVVVAESAFASLEDNVADGVRQLTGLPPFPFAPLIVWFGERETGASISALRPIDDIDDIAPRPLLLVHGEQDTLIHVSNSQRLYEAAGEPKELYLIPDAGHSNLMDTNPAEFERRVIGFLDRYLQE